MSDTRSPFVRALRGLARLYVEISILLFCALIVSATGSTQGPVFDTVGPDFFPTALALIVGALTAIQIAMVVAGREDPDALPGKPDATMLRNAAIFMVVTIAYVMVLSQRMAPLFLATSVFMAFTTPLLSHRASWRDGAVGAVIGLILGGVLQFVFTQIVVIDLSG